ncbi:MAG TPA: thioesterase family protein [Leptolyngbyaceae cyanobacterium]
MAYSIPTLDPFTVELSFKVQPYDLNGRGLVSEFAYLRWLESLRQELLSQHFSSNQNCHPVLVSTQIEYKLPIQSQSVLTGRLWLANLGKTQWTLQAKLTSLGDTVATAVQVGHFVAATELCSLPIPDSLAQQYWNYQWDL